MATKVRQWLYTKDDGAGGVSSITGATATVHIVRASDGYAYNSGTAAFVASGETDPTASEVADGWYSYSVATTSWTNGAYLVSCVLTKTGESPISYAETWDIYGGAVTGGSPSAPSAAGTCRVFLYWTDLPATAPTSTVRTVGTSTSTTNADATTYTPTYNSGTGLWYADVPQGAVVRFHVLGRGVERLVRVPALTTVSLTTLEDLP